MDNKYVLTFALVMALGTAGFAANNSLTTNAVPTDNKSAISVLSDLNHTNLMEIEMGQLAKKKGKSRAVREYGETLINDHQKSQEQVKELADQLSIKLADKDETLAEKDHQMMAKLEKLKEASFDRAFAEMMVNDHSKGISRLEEAQKTATGAAADLIAQTLPVLRQHKETAEQLLINLKTKREPS
jgi:putative membrane protein